MAIQPQDHEQAGSDRPAAGSSPAAAATPSRRRFGKAGLAAGVILTLRSTPGMATNNLACFAPSGLVSGTIQSKNTVVRSCGGRSPGYWVQLFKSWPSGCTRGAAYTSIFPSGTSGCYGTYSLQQMLLANRDVDKYNIGSHMVAAYLNARSVNNYVVSLATLQAIWTEWFSSNKYTPTAGTEWDGEQIVLYLKGTFDNKKHDPTLNWD